MGWRGVLAAVALCLGAGPAAALTLGFGCVSGNLASDCASGEAQFEVELSAGPGANQVSFLFTNVGAASSSISEVYFDDGTLLSLASVENGVGVDFAAGGSPPDLPSGGNATPAFVTTFMASAAAPSPMNGVNPGETLTLVFDLVGGKTLSDTEAALADGSLRIGLHAQSFASGGSESFVTVPEPAVALLLAGPLLVLVGRRGRLG